MRVILFDGAGDSGRDDGLELYLESTQIDGLAKEVQVGSDENLKDIQSLLSISRGNERKGAV